MDGVNKKYYKKTINIKFQHLFTSHVRCMEKVN